MIFRALFSLLLIAPTLALAQPIYLPPARAPGAINPAVTQANLDETICRPGGYTRSIRPPLSYTEPLKRRLLRASGFSDQHLRDYELDHRIPLCVGGAPFSESNLWVEPRFGVWGAAKKDALEREIMWRVCHGRMSLSVGQAVFECNWVAGYQKYVLPWLQSHPSGYRPHRYRYYWQY